MTLNKDNMKKIEKAHRTYAIIYGDAGLKSGDSEFILNNIRLLRLFFFFFRIVSVVLLFIIC